MFGERRAHRLNQGLLISMKRARVAGLQSGRKIYKVTQRCVEINVVFVHGSLPQV